MMDSVQLNHDGKCIEEMFSEQLFPPDSPEISDIFGEPQVLARVGVEYQVKIPSMIIESERLQLLKNPAEMEVIDVSHSFLMGLPVPVMWIDDEVNNHKNRVGSNSDSDDSVNPIEALGSKTCEKSHISSNKRVLQIKVESSNLRSENKEKIKLPSSEPEMQGKANWDQMYRDKSCCLVPGLLGDTESGIHVDSFLLGLYIFGKNFVQLKTFMEIEEMGKILAFYYGKFYGSDGRQRWSDCRKMRSRKSILGHRIFTGWRQQELLSRLLPHVSEEVQNTIVELSKTFTEGRTSLEEYVTTLKMTSGISVLVEAVGIGKGKKDLTSLSVEPSKTNQVFPVRPEIPIGKACSSLTSGEIIKFLTGDFRLSKARSSDLFWEAVWPRLLARGWHSEQPKNRDFSDSKNCLVFLMPGVNKFSRRKLVKRDHYFDSIVDVLSKVAAEPKLLELEAEEPGVLSCKEGLGWEPETTLDQNDPSDHQRHCYLKPRKSTSDTNLMKFTIVDTSLSPGEKSSKVSEVRCLPADCNTFNMSRDLRETEDDSSEDLVFEPDSANMSLNIQKVANFSKQAKDVFDNSSSNQRMQIKGSEAAKKLIENHQDHNTNTSNDKQSRRIIKHQISQKVKPGQSNFLAPVMKRRRLAACGKAETSRNMENFTVCPELKPVEPSSMVKSPGACKNVLSHVGHSQEKEPSSSSLAEDSPKEDSSGILNGSSYGMMMSHEKFEKPQPWPLIDLNLPQIPPDSEIGEPCMMEMDDNQETPDANRAGIPSATSKLVEDSKELKISDNDNGAEKQPIVNPRRQSTRNRPLTARALEALASGFLSRRTRKGTESQKKKNPISRSSRRSLSRAVITSDSGITGIGTVESKEEKDVDGGWNGKKNMLSESLVESERKAVQELLEISKSVYHPEDLHINNN